MSTIDRLGDDTPQGVTLQASAVGAVRLEWLRHETLNEGGEPCAIHSNTDPSNSRAIRATWNSNSRRANCSRAPIGSADTTAAALRVTLAGRSGPTPCPTGGRFVLGIECLELSPRRSTSCLAQMVQRRETAVLVLSLPSVQPSTIRGKPQIASTPSALRRWPFSAYGVSIQSPTFTIPP